MATPTIIATFRHRCLDHGHDTIGTDEGWNTHKTRKCIVCTSNIKKYIGNRTIKRLLSMLIDKIWDYAREYIKKELQERKKEMYGHDDLLVALFMAHNPKRYKDWELIR